MWPAEIRVRGICGKEIYYYIIYLRSHDHRLVCRDLQTSGIHNRLHSNNNIISNDISQSQL